MRFDQCLQASRNTAKIGGVVLGCQEITIPKRYSLFCVTFKDVAGGDYDIQNIQVLNKDGSLYENTLAKVTIQKMLIDGDNDGAFDTDKLYSWKKKKTDGTFYTCWHKGNDRCIGDLKVEFAPGEAASIYNNTGSPIMIKYKSPIEK